MRRKIAATAIFATSKIVAPFWLEAAGPVPDILPTAKAPVITLWATHYRANYACSVTGSAHFLLPAESELCVHVCL